MTVHFLIVALVAVAFASEPQPAGSESNKPGEECELTEEGQLKKLEAQRKIYSKSSDECFKALEEEIKKCGKEDTAQRDCAGVEAGSQPAPTGGQVTKAQLSQQVKDNVRSANCSRRRAKCFGDLGYKTKACGRDKKPKPEDPEYESSLLAGATFLRGRSYERCAQEQAKANEKTANETLDFMRAISSDGNETQNPAIVCSEKYYGRVCAFDERGELGTMREADLNSKDPVEKGAGTVNLGGCSGTRLAGGEHISTATHCVEPNPSGGLQSRDVKIVQEDGTVVSRIATCGVGDSFKNEVTICKLDTPVSGPDNYFLVRDDSLTACQNVGYERRCPSSAIAALENRRATLTGYTYLGDQQRMVHSEGYLRYNPDNGRMEFTGPTQQGLSGAGYYTTMDGQRIFVAPHIGASGTYSPIGGYTIVPTPAMVDQARSLTGIKPQTLINGQPLMRELLVYDVLDR